MGERTYEEFLHYLATVSTGISTLENNLELYDNLSMHLPMT